MKRAFSLVELSIVLVILGLLVGGVLSGQSLIRAAQLRSVSADVGKYQSALHSFRDKYFTIPGDFNAATRFWGRLNNNADCVTNSAAAVSATGVCDGDGSGSVNFTGATAGQSYESFQATRELAIAGLIEGNYSGLATTGPAGVTPGTNVGTNKLGSSVAIVFTTLDPSSGNFLASIEYNINYGNSIAIAPSDASGILLPEEAWNIDTKMDDGKPGTGKLIAGRWDTCTTSANNSDFNGAYDLTLKVNECWFLVKNII